MNSVERFEIIHDNVIASKEVSKMRIADMIMRSAIERLYKYNPSSVDELNEIYEGAVEYNNYLSREEAESISNTLKWNDGNEGAHWDEDTFFNACRDYGFDTDKKPYYNKYALWLTANAIVSDYSQVIEKWSNGDQRRFYQIVTELSIAKLMDADKKNFIRWYFSV